MNDYRRLVVGLVSGLVLAASACAPSGATTAAPAGPPRPAATTDPPGPTAAPGPRIGPADPTAPRSYVPVRRSGKAAAARVHGTEGKLQPATAVRYTDDITIRITLLTRRSEQGFGPGVFPGRSLTMAKIALTNGSGRAIDVSQVVVTATHGQPARIAAPVYPDARTADFAGSVGPGRTATAQYAFAIAGKSAPVTIIVDWDRAHEPAVFTGRTN